MDKKVLVELTAEVVAAHVSVNEMGKEELLDELDSVFQKLCALAGEEAELSAAAPVETKPAVELSQAFGKDKVYCMVCGKGFTTLKKHIATSHKLSPKDYRKKFNIPAKTALVAKNYSEQKKKIAQTLGLAEKLAEGRKKRKARK